MSILSGEPNNNNLRENGTGTSANSANRHPRERNLGVFQDVGTTGTIEQAAEKIDLAALIEPKKYAGRYKKLRDELHGNIAGLGILVGSTDTSLQADGVAIIDHSERLANSITDLAEKNERLYEILCKLLEGGGWMGLLMAIASLANAIAMNHGVNVGGATIAAMKAGWQKKKEAKNAPDAELSRVA